MQTFSDYGFLGALLLIGLLLGAIPVLIPLLISPRTRGGKKTHETYECGMDTIGSAWVRFGVSFYLFALIFVAFEVDVLYLLPVALVYDNETFANSWRDLIETVLFLGILSLAILYAWRKGVFSWESELELPREAAQRSITTPAGVSLERASEKEIPRG